MLGQASLEEDDENKEDSAFLVHGTGLGQSCLREESANLGLSTCCAKTVARQDWVKARVAKLKDSGLPFKYFQEREPLRFGSGPKILSSRAMVFPLCIPGRKLPVMLRTSIVEQDVPLLISRGALQSVGMIMNLVDNSMRFEQLACAAVLVTTSTDHVGLQLMSLGAHWGLGVDWSGVDEKKQAETFFGEKLGGVIQLRNLGCCS